MKKVFDVVNYEVFFAWDGDELVEDGRTEIGIYASFPLKEQAEDYCKAHCISTDDIEEREVEE